MDETSYYLSELSVPERNPEEELEEKRERLLQEIAEYHGPGKGYTNRLRKFMETNGIWELKDLDYGWRIQYEKELKKELRPDRLRWHLRGFDHLKQYSMRKSGRLWAERKPPGYFYENCVLFLPYHPVQELVKRMDNAQERPDWIWDFSLPVSEQMKRQIYACLNYFLKEKGDAGLLRTRLSALQMFYQFCAEKRIEDIEQINLLQTQEYQRVTEEKNPEAFRIRNICRKVLFLQAEEIHWNANVWYLERLHLESERMNPAKLVVSLSFVEVTHDGNRRLLQKYMKYGLGLTNLTINSLQSEMLDIREILQGMKEDACEITESQMIRYLRQLQEQKIKPETFNRKLMALQHFYNFLLAKRYIFKIPFRVEYYLKKTMPMHHNRSVSQEIEEEILNNLYQLPEHLRLMYLHLWGLGLRISEVCRLKGDAYYIQGRDAWIQIYQTKMKNYKRIPIPWALYQLMQVYLKRNGITADKYVFPNTKGGAYRSGTFRAQMIGWCKRQKFHNGEYLFRPHDYRHKIATYFYDSGVSLQGIRDYLGHNYEEMTQQYIDYMPRKIEKASQEFFKKQGNSLAACLKGGGEE